MNKWCSVAIVTVMVVAPLWAAIASARGLHWVVVLILFAHGLVAWVAEGPEGLSSILPRGARLGVILAGAMVGVGYVVGYAGAPGPSVLRDFLVAHDWATGLALSLVAFGGAVFVVEVTVV